MKRVIFAVCLLSLCSVFITATEPQRQGFALEVQGGFDFEISHTGLSPAVALTYQFPINLTLGVFFGTTYRPTEHPSHRFYFIPYNFGARILYGNKVDSLAMGINLGLPSTLTFYFKNFFFNIGTDFSPWTDHTFIDFGYSFYLGK